MLQAQQEVKTTGKLALPDRGEWVYDEWVLIRSLPPSAEVGLSFAVELETIAPTSPIALTFSITCADEMGRLFVSTEDLVLDPVTGALERSSTRRLRDVGDDG